MRAGWAKAAVAGTLLSLVTALSACAADPGWQPRVASIEATVARAESLGAMRCAPRELALARAHLGFAQMERERGHRSRAREHLAVAEPNAQAAAYLSPSGRCSEAVADDPEVGPRSTSALDPTSPGSATPADLTPAPRTPPESQTAGEPGTLDPVANDPALAVAALDQDQDGVPDGDDECPAVAGEAGAACPGAYTGLVVRAESLVLLRPVTLDSAGAPDEPTLVLLRAIVQALRDRPSMVLEVGAHTDSDGTELENLAESQRRAENVRTRLIALGADPLRVRARGYGEELPIESNGTPEGRAANERVELLRVEAGAGAF